MRFPDILLKMEDGYIPSNDFNDFIVKHDYRNYNSNLNDIYRDHNKVCKASKPLFAIYKKETPGSEDPGAPLGEQIRRESSTSASLPL